jgi:transposase
MARRKQRYPSDTSDGQWELIEPLLPQVNTAGRREEHPRRATRVVACTRKRLLDRADIANPFKWNDRQAGKAEQHALAR